VWILGHAEAALDAPALAVKPLQKADGRVPVTGGQVPGALHGGVADAQHGADRVVFGRHHRVAQQCRPSVFPHPTDSRARFAIRCHPPDIAAEADDVVEAQFLGQHPIQLSVAEAAIGDNAAFGLAWQHQTPVRRGRVGPVSPKDRDTALRSVTLAGVFTRSRVGRAK